MKNIYVNGGRYYKKVTVGCGRFRGMYLWQPMKKVLWFLVKDTSRRRFWLDDSGFERVPK